MPADNGGHFCVIFVYNLRSMTLLMNCIRCLPLTFVVLFLGCSESQHEIEYEKLQSLRQAYVPVQSIDPDDTTFSDLLPLIPVLNNKKIVMLGEQSHGDGATFLAKIRLIKFLHQKMGFDVLAMESGLFDCEYAGSRIADGHPPFDAIRNSTFDVWTSSRQFLPLMEYITGQQHTPRPLHLSGFDLQITGKYGRDSLVLFLRRVIGSTEKLNEEERWTLRMLDTLTAKTKRFVQIPRSIHQRLYDGIRSIVVIVRLKNIAADEKAFWIQLLNSLETFARFLWNVDFNKPDLQFMNLRDSQMADNLLWLSRVRYPDAKIIVWAASSHISRNRHEIMNRAHADTAMVPMGHHVWKAMRDSVYILGFTAFEGTMGLRRRSGTVLAKARPGTLEDILHHTDDEYGWLDFQQLPEKHWLHDTARARPFGYNTMTARWTSMMDGMFYIKTMTPSIAIED